jgi:hypothetical protein
MARPAMSEGGPNNDKVFTETTLNHGASTRQARGLGHSPKRRGSDGRRLTDAVIVRWRSNIREAAPVAQEADLLLGASSGPTRGRGGAVRSSTRGAAVVK